MATSAGLALASAANAQVLYDNGGYKTGTLSASGVMSPAGTQWSEVQNDAGNTTQSNTVAGFADNHDAGFRLADDFLVPAGQTWEVSSVCLYGYKTLAAIPAVPVHDLATLRIWNGRPGDAGAAIIFGDSSTNRLVSATDDLAYRVFNTLVPAPGTAPGTTRKVWKVDASALTAGEPLLLTSGTYWVDWSLSDTANGAHFAPSRTIVGTRALPGWNGRQFVGGTTNLWQDTLDAGNPATAPDHIHDLLFQVKGTVQPVNDCLLPLPACNGDVFPAGGNGQVDIDDLIQGVINNWGQTGPPRPMGDCFPLPNGNCTVDVDDLIQGVINNWGPCVPIPK